MDEYDSANNASDTGIPANKTVYHASILKKSNLIICGVIAVFILIYLSSPKQQGLSPIPGETQFSISGLNGETCSFRYDEIENIELRTDLKNYDLGVCVKGTENKNYYSGLFRNEEFGEYQLQVSSKLNMFIVVKTEDGVLIFNYEANETTKSLYSTICEYAGR